MFHTYNLHKLLQHNFVNPSKAWKEADEREQGTPLREADQMWLKSYNKKTKKDLAKKKKHC